jgi:Uncharacterised nucleotidyltransferase
VNLMLSRELNAVVACCASVAQAPGRLGEILKVTNQRLVDQCNGQGMLPLLSRALDVAGPMVLPPELLAGIREKAARKTLRSLIMAAELTHLMQSFENAGVAAIAFKGPTLGYLAYGDAALRDSADLDIYIPRQQLRTALTLLAADGYDQNSPGVTTSLPGACEVALRRRNPECEIDLHWQFSPPYFVQFDGARAIERSVIVKASGLVARTLCPEDLLIYLCIHAARECWTFRSICDLGALLWNQAIDWDDLLRETGRARCWRMVAVGLRLAVGIVDAPLPPNVRSEVDRDPIVRAIADRLAANLTFDVTDYGGAPGGALLHLKMLETLALKASYLWRRALQPNQLDAGFIHLPASLSAAYYLIRPLRVACRALGRLRSR